MNIILGAVENKNPNSSTKNSIIDNMQFLDIKRDVADKASYSDLDGLKQLMQKEVREL